MSDVLSLATRLRGMPEPELARTIAARELATASIHDTFDLAEEFLEPASVQAALSRLDRGTLAVIAVAGGGDGVTVPELAARLGVFSGVPADVQLTAHRVHRAASLLLLEGGAGKYQPYRTVDAQLRDWPQRGLPSAAELAAGTPPALIGRVPGLDPESVDRLAAERAFAATTATAELLIELERNPARELAKGGVSLPDTKRLAHRMAVELPAVARFLAIAHRAGLVANEAGSWLLTERGAQWLLEASDQRWLDLASGWVADLPEDLRGILGARSHAIWGDGLRAYIDWFYPAGGEWMTQRIRRSTREAELLGVAAAKTSSAPGALLLAGDPDARSTMAGLFPQTVDQVYVQHDLSIVAPGPLAPRVDARLRALADVDSRGLAFSYRISTGSVNRALAHGASAESLLALLAEVSLTGIPQPVEYLINEACARYGLLRVGPVTEGPEPVVRSRGARSYLRSDHAELLETVRVDQTLAGLGLVRSAADRLISRADEQTLFWALSDARYPVAAENDRHELVALRRRHIAASDSDEAGDAIQALIERVKAADRAEPADAGQAWLARRLEVAIREKSSVAVTVAMPNGTEVEYVVEPASLRHGRLRAHDRRSDLERTLPLSSIVALAPAVTTRTR